MLLLLVFYLAKSTRATQSHDSQRARDKRYSMELSLKTYSVLLTTFAQLNRIVNKSWLVAGRESRTEITRIIMLVIIITWYSLPKQEGKITSPRLTSTKNLNHHQQTKTAILGEAIKTLFTLSVVNPLKKEISHSAMHGNWRCFTPYSPQTIICTPSHPVMLPLPFPAFPHLPNTANSPRTR